MSTKHTANARARRNPNGVVTEKPIAIRLLPEELALVKRFAQREQRSMASVCRLAVVQALADCAKAGKPLAV